MKKKNPNNVFLVIFLTPAFPVDRWPFFPSLLPTPAVLQNEKGTKKKSVHTSGPVKHGLMDLILARRHAEFNLLTSCERRRGRASEDEFSAEA